MRPDGRRVKNADPMYTITPYIMPKRYDATNIITVDIPIEPMQQYRNNLRKQGMNVSNLALLVTAYIKTVREYPYLNRFVVNKRIYDRNELCISMVVLRPGEEEGTMSKVYFDDKDNIFTVQEKMDAYITESRNVSNQNSMDSIMKILTGIPGMLGIMVGILKGLDKWGLMPKAVIDASPFHSSLVISNLASIRTNHVYHHVYEFGTTGIVITMGNLHEVPVRIGGEIQFRRCLPLGIVTDERICSGHYYALAFRKIKQLLANPTLLEAEPAVQ